MEGKGRAVCVGADIDTDLIIAGRYLRTKDHSVWTAHVFEDLDSSLAGRMNGAVIVAGKNFGCGSSREQAAVAIREGRGCCSRGALLCPDIFPECDQCRAPAHRMQSFLP